MDNVHSNIHWIFTEFIYITCPKSRETKFKIFLCLDGTDFWEKNYIVKKVNIQPLI